MYDSGRKLMNIGKKIKKVRLSKAMTQSELAGEYITRNMLSQIENGSATPSVATISYIAQKLEMPVGYFLAESENDFLYSKMLCIDALKKAYSEKRYTECIEICKENLHDFDDEIYLILCECHFHAARSFFDAAHLVSAHKEFNTVLHYAEKTVYNVEWIRTSTFVYLQFISDLVPSLKSELLNLENSTDTSAIYGDMYTYINAKRLIDENKIDVAQALLNRDDFCKSSLSKHIRAMIEMKSARYAQAFEIMHDIEKNDNADIYGRPFLFAIYSDMEVCCRENGDFEHAYEYATKKSEIIPEMGK